MKVDIFVNIKHITTIAKHNLNLTDFTIKPALQPGEGVAQQSCLRRNLLVVICNELFEEFANQFNLINPRQSKECLMTNFSPKIYRVAWLEFFVPRQRFFVIACNRKQPIGEGSWNKEISSFSPPCSRTQCPSFGLVPKFCPCALSVAMFLFWATDVSLKSFMPNFSQHHVRRKGYSRTYTVFLLAP